MMARERFVASMERITTEIGEMVRRKKLPDIDTGLMEREYLLKKANGFIRYCRKKRYLLDPPSGGKDEGFILDKNHLYLIRTGVPNANPSDSTRTSFYPSGK